MSQTKLKRKISLLQASAINMTDMVGIGVFVTLGLIAGSMRGYTFLYAWIAGAVLCYFDAMVYSELGATFPLAGGTYYFLKYGYGEKWGKLMSFLLVWQTMLQGPLGIASVAIGFTQYAGYIIPLTETTGKILSVSVVALTVFLLYRRIEAVAKISVLLWVGVIITIVWIIIGGLLHGNFLQPVKKINDGLHLNAGFVAALGFASMQTVYSYGGYSNVCSLGSEIINPKKNIPRSIIISLTVIFILFLLLNISVASVLPLTTVQHSTFVISEFMQSIGGKGAANLATGLILWASFASGFSIALACSRVPYAAAVDGAFFKIFAKLHPVRNFPYVSLLVIGALAIIFTLSLKLSELISALLAMGILIGSVGPAVGLLLLSRREGRKAIAWRMLLYPVPVLVAILMWLYIFYSTGLAMMTSAIIAICIGAIAYLIQAYRKKEWPFEIKV